MTRSLIALALLLAVPRDDEGFVPLFNGRDFEGWQFKDKYRDHWTVKDGIIDYDGQGGGDLWTEKEFADFVLKVDWRLPRKGDSGIYLRGSSKSQVNIWVNPLGSGEVYGYRTDNKMPEEVRKAVTPSKVADKPVGEWNSFEITMKGERLTVILNGEKVIDSARLPGVKPAGRIALQHHGDPVQFRNIRLRELK